MDDKKRLFIELLLQRIFNDNKSTLIEQINPQELHFFRPVTQDFMIRFKMTWNNDLDFRIVKCTRGKEILQVYVTSIWFKVNDYIRIRNTDVIKYLKFN